MRDPLGFNQWRQNLLFRVLSRLRINAHPAKNHFAFTLMELMMAVAIFSILAAIAVPSGMAWRNNQRFNGAVREVKGALENTRMSTIRTDMRGLVQFTDGTNGFTTQQLDRTGAWNVTNTVLLANDIQISSNFPADQVVYNNRGMLQASAGTITVQSANGLCQTVVVSIVGSSRIDNCP